jgi:hypothetical protein
VRSESTANEGVSFNIVEKYCLKDVGVDGVALLVEAIAEHGRRTITCNITPVDMAMRMDEVPTVGQVTPNTDDGEVRGQRLGKASPIDGGVVPNRSLNNDLACVSGRVTNLQKIAKKTVVSSELKRDMDEFLDLLGLPELQPTGIETVKERQNRPTQRELITQAEPWLNEHWATKGIKAFQKDESYPDRKDPRNISTIDTVTKVLYCFYMYPVMDHVKTYGWYAFGQTPKVIASKVATTTTGSFVETDFSRFDGTQNSATRCLEEKFIKRVYKGENAKACLHLWNLGRRCPAKTTNGVKYKTGDSRLSGSPETSVFNTLINVFISWKALKSTGLTGQAAYDRLGNYGGDDGITPWDKDPQDFSKNAQECGLVLKCEIKHNYAGFLGRIYVDGQHSILDVRRQLSKINIVVGSTKGVPAMVHAWNKWNGLLITDPNTPIVADICRAGIRILSTEKTFKVPKRKDKNKKNEIWWSEHELSDQFPQLSYDDNIQHVLSLLGQNRAWFDAYKLSIDSAQTMDELFAATQIC